jgi:hypothetical protein
MNISLKTIDIERLVDGELSESDRLEVLRLIETTPDGWQRCALAFLEAQAFTQALKGQSCSPKTTSRPRHRVAKLAMAASLLAVAFYAGFASRGGPERPSEGVEPPIVLAQQTPAEPNTSKLTEVLRVKPQEIEISDYVREQWERRGYLIEKTQKSYSMNLDDGRKVSIPVDNVELRFVGRPTY